MAAVKSFNTGPELLVRRLLNAAGFRFRLHRKDLPGKPDIVLPKYNVVIFVHGCFWHQHLGCKSAARPTTRTEYWNLKLDGNVKRDALKKSELEAQGWRVLTFWECETKNATALSTRLQYEIRHESTVESAIAS